MDKKTLNYYDENAIKFVNETINVDFVKVQNKFINKLAKDAYILDFGCGSGRDTKYFLENDFKVDAIDGSLELCKLASKFTGIDVKHMYFQDLCEKEKYDGIWACASILHLNMKDLKDVFLKMITALKFNGVIYTSFKYGNLEGNRNGRYFTNMDEAKFDDFIDKYDNITVEELWVTADVRPGRSEEKWLNLILRKKK